MGLLSPYAMMGMAQGAQKGLNAFLDDESKQRLEEARLVAQEQMNIRSEARSEARTVAAEGRKKDDAAAERKRKADYMAPQTSQSNGLLSEAAGLNDADVRTDENVGVDVQNRSRPATYKQGAQKATEAGDFESAKLLEGMDNSDEKIKNAQVLAEMRQRYNTDRLTQQGQLAMMKLAASIAKGGSGGSSKESDFVQDLKYLKELEPKATIDELKETYAQLKRGVAPRTETTEKEGMTGKETAVKTITPGAAKIADKSLKPAVNRSSQFNVLR